MCDLLQKGSFIVIVSLGVYRIVKHCIPALREGGGGGTKCLMQGPDV